MDQTHRETQRTLKPKPSNVKPKSNLIWTIQKHINVTNHVRINKVASIHFDYHFMIFFSKCVLAQNQNSMIKFQ